MLPVSWIHSPGLILPFILASRDLGGHLLDPRGAYYGTQAVSGLKKTQHLPLLDITTSPTRTSISHNRSVDSLSEDTHWTGQTEEAKRPTQKGIRECPTSGSLHDAGFSSVYGWRRDAHKAGRLVRKNRSYTVRRLARASRARVLPITRARRLRAGDSVERDRRSR